MTETIPAGYMMSEEFARDPYALNRKLREQGPVHRIDFPPGADAFLVVGYEQVRAAFTDPRLSKDLRNGPEWFRERMITNSPVLAHTMITADPPDHSRLRGLVAKELSPRQIHHLRPRIRQITDELVDGLPGSGSFDLLDTFCVPLPLTVICELLGVPPADRPAFREWTMLLVQSAYVQGEAAERRRAASVAMEDYFDRLARARAAEPRDDLITTLVAARDRGQCRHEEVISTLVFLLIAGHETTVHMLGNAILALMLNPRDMDELRRRPEGIPSAVEEFLRYDGPAERGTVRFATEDMVLAGTFIPRGSFVHLSMGSAHRDPAAFDHPDRIDTCRKPNSHMAFGHGIHFCLGAPLARLEAEIALETLLRRAPDLEPAVTPGELRWIANSSIVHGLEELPVRRART